MNNTSATFKFFNDTGSTLGLIATRHSPRDCTAFNQVSTPTETTDFDLCMTVLKYSICIKIIIP